MIRQTPSGYTYYELKRELSKIFESIHFDDLTFKMIVQSSYFDNFDQLIAYASNNNIDEKEYIRSIRSVLLSNQHINNITR